jgi:hypothetical protein
LQRNQNGDGGRQLVWSNAEPTRAAAGIERTAMGQPTVQTTVHKNGFDRNQYATFSRVDTKGEEMRPEAVGAIPGERVRAYNLRLVEFSNPEPSASFTAEEPRGSEAFVLVENLEPGLNYVWRLRFPRDSGFFETQTVTCEAPVCPADRPQED